MTHHPTLEEIADAQVAAQANLHFDGDMDYEEWLEETGLDDSFVGDGVSVPGTEDLYDAARRLYQSQMNAESAMRVG